MLQFNSSRSAARRNLIAGASLAAAVLFASLLPGVVRADDPELEERAAGVVRVHLDNAHIQSFRGRLGQWVAPGGESLASLGQRYGVSVEEIQRYNEGHAGLYFIPMGLEYYNELVRQGKGRRVLRLDPRKLLWPVEDVRYTSRYGYRRGDMHTGVDLACAPNSIVLAADDGVVVNSGWYGALGNAIAIEHNHGLVTWYAHNNRLLLSVGEQVRRGQAIAFSGNTGRSTGPHVHFEVRYRNVAMDPEDFLQLGFYGPAVVLREESPIDGSYGESALNVDRQGDVRIGN